VLRLRRMLNAGTVSPGLRPWLGVPGLTGILFAPWGRDRPLDGRRRAPRRRANTALEPAPG